MRAPVPRCCSHAMRLSRRHLAASCLLPTSRIASARDPPPLAAMDFKAKIGEFGLSGRSPMIQAGGLNMKEETAKSKPSIWRPPDHQGKPRVHLPAEAARYPETKHTLPCARSI